MQDQEIAINDIYFSVMKNIYLWWVLYWGVDECKKHEKELVSVFDFYIIISLCFYFKLLCFTKFLFSLLLY